MALLTQRGWPGSLMQVREGQTNHVSKTLKQESSIQVPVVKRPWNAISAWRTEHHEVFHTREISCCRGGCEGNKSVVCLQISWRFQWNTIHSSPMRHLNPLGIPGDVTCSWHPQGVVTQCWPHFACPITSGLSQCLSSPNLSPSQAGSPMGPATGFQQQGGEVG